MIIGLLIDYAWDADLHYTEGIISLHVWGQVEYYIDIHSYLLYPARGGGLNNCSHNLQHDRFMSLSAVFWQCVSRSSSVLVGEGMGGC